MLRFVNLRSLPKVCLRRWKLISSVDFNWVRQYFVIHIHTYSWQLNTSVTKYRCDDYGVLQVAGVPFYPISCLNRTRVFNQKLTDAEWRLFQATFSDEGFFKKKIYTVLDVWDGSNTQDSKMFPVIACIITGVFAFTLHVYIFLHSDLN